MHKEPPRLRLETVPPAQMPAVLRVAADLYAQEQAQIAQAEQHHHLVQAAIEVGLPAEYLERAAAIVAEQQAERESARLQRKGRRERWGSLIALGVAVGIVLAGLGQQVNRLGSLPALPPPPSGAAAIAPISPGPAVPLMGPCTEVDLSPYVTQRLDEPMLGPGNHLGTLLAGLRAGGVSHRTLRGVPFRLDGVVLVGPGETFSGDGVATKVEPQVEDIAIEHPVKRLHFLHGTHWRARDGAEIGAYIVHYEDGTRLEIPIRYGEDVRDWWERSDPEPRVTRAQVAWSGSNEASSQRHSGIRLYLSSWENPYPERTIRSLDMVTGEQGAGPAAPAPFLVGLTLEQESPPVVRARSPSKATPRRGQPS
jgi:hypothetical protein